VEHGDATEIDAFSTTALVARMTSQVRRTLFATGDNLRDVIRSLVRHS
jgi:hypothetical protein